MPSERFAEVERLVAAALALPTAERGAFVADACGADAALRGEVESLLAGAHGLAGFLEGDALDDAAPLFAEPAAAAMPPGARLGPYRLERLLGAGGMGQVYLAHDERLDRRIALKLLAPELAADPQWRHRFLEEARLASAVDHPNLCTIHEVGEVAGTPYIAMQYVEGETLKELIGGRPLPTERWVPLALQVAEALAAAHQHGIVHRDVKSGNVVVTPRGQAKVLDFGIAKRLDERAQAEAMQLTAAGAVLGTPASMSPEQASGEAADRRSDVFSLGVVMYEMATGGPPFVGFSRSEVLRAVVSRPHEVAEVRNPELEAPLARVIDRALAKSPGERYASMGELIEDLRRAAGEAGSGPARARRRWLAPALAAVLVVAIVVIALAVRARSGPSSGIASLAVLPFRPLVQRQADEALELGMADTLISRLESLPALQVRSIGAVQRYAGRAVDPVAVGREQRVDAVLDGRIQKAGAGLRVTVRLVRVADGKALWSDRFDSTMTDLFAVQDSIAERVAAAVAPRLSGEQRARLTHHPTEDPEAYRLYLLGRYHLTRMSDDGFWKALSHFQQAAAADPGFAPAFAGLADAWLSLGIFNVQPPKQVFPQSRRAAEQALRLDARLAGPHVVLANVSFNYDWQWQRAEAEFRRALELEPDSSEAHQMYAYFLALRGRSAEALREMRRAHELDPLALPCITGLGEIFYLARRFEESEAQHRRALDMDPNLGFAHWGLGRALAAQGRYEEAIAAFRRSIPLSGDSPDEPAELARTYALAGRAAEARQILAQLELQAQRRYVAPAVFATIHGALGERDRAFSWLDRAVAERDFLLVSLAVEPIFDSLRDDPRFAALVRRIGLAT